MSSDTTFTMPADARIAGVTLRVGDADRVAAFYRDVVGLAVDRAGAETRLSAGGDPLVVLREDPDAPPRPDDAAGLFHLAVRVPTRAALGEALSRIESSDATLAGASDHLVSEALYLGDPEGNGVEVYRDRPRSEWPVEGDRVGIDTLPLDLGSVREAAPASPADRVPTGTDLGHVHLEVTSLDAARAFYVDALGLTVRTESYDGALFVAAGDYHHHVGLNVWNGRSAPAGASRGLDRVAVAVPAAALPDCRASLSAAGYPVESVDGGRLVADPDGIDLLLRPTE